MSCCGQKRWSAVDPLRSGLESPPRKVRIVYLGESSFKVHGTYTGQTYVFSPRRRVQLVDAGDSRVLLRTRYFRRAAGSLS